MTFNKWAKMPEQGEETSQQMVLRQPAAMQNRMRRALISHTH